MILGNLKTEVVKLSGSQATLMESGKERRVITGIFLSNITGGALTATLDVTRSSVDYNICTAKNVPANGTVVFEGQHGPLVSMADGDILKGSCSSANNVHALITYTELGPAGS